MNETELESLIVRLVGDADEYLKMLDEARSAIAATAKQIETMAAAIEGAGSEMLHGAASQASAAADEIGDAGEAMEGASSAAESTSDVMSSLGDSLNNVGTVVSGVKDAFGDFQDTLEEVAAAYIAFRIELAVLNTYAEAELANIRLGAAIKSHGGDVQAVTEDYRRFAIVMQETTATAITSTTVMLQQAESLGIAGEAAKRAVRNAIGLAAAKGGEASSYIRATAALEKGHVIVRLIDPALAKVAEGSERVAAAQAKLAKDFEVATASMSSVRKQSQQLSNAVSDLAEDLGGVLAPGFSVITNALIGVITWFRDLNPIIKTTTLATASLAVAIFGLVAVFTPLRLAVVYLIDSYKSLKVWLTDIDGAHKLVTVSQAASAVITKILTADLLANTTATAVNTAAQAGLARAITVLLVVKRALAATIFSLPALFIAAAASVGVLVYKLYTEQQAVKDLNDELERSKRLHGELDASRTKVVAKQIADADALPNNQERAKVLTAAVAHAENDLAKMRTTLARLKEEAAAADQQALRGVMPGYAPGKWQELSREVELYAKSVETAERNLKTLARAQHIAATVSRIEQTFEPAQREAEAARLIATETAALEQQEKVIAKVKAGIEEAKATWTPSWLGGISDEKIKTVEAALAEAEKSYEAQKMQVEALVKAKKELAQGYSDKTLEQFKAETEELQKQLMFGDDKVLRGAYENLPKAALDARKAVMELLKAKKEEKDADEEIAKSKEDFLKASQGLVDGLREELEVWGMSSDRAKLHKMILDGMHPAYVKAAEAIIATKEALDKIKESLSSDPVLNYAQAVKDLTALLNSGQIKQPAFDAILKGMDKEMQKAGDAITKSLRTPMEQYQEEVNKLQILLNKKAITQETFERGMKKAQEELDKTGKEAKKAKQEIQKFDAALADSADAATRISAYQALFDSATDGAVQAVGGAAQVADGDMEPERHPWEVDDIAAVEIDRGNKLLVNIRDLIREGNQKPGLEVEAANLA